MSKRSVSSLAFSDGFLKLSLELLFFLFFSVFFIDVVCDFDKHLAEDLYKGNGCGNDQYSNNHVFILNFILAQDVGKPLTAIIEL